MDHYSPLLANCVGHHNLKYFVLTNCYAVAHVAFCSASLLSLPLTGVSDFLMTKVVPVMLLAYHILICYKTMRGLPFGYTTLEWHENRHEKALLWGQASLYDRGTSAANIFEVMGKNILTMMLPLGPGMQGDGIALRLSPEGELLVRGGESPRITTLTSHGESDRGTKKND